MFRPNRVRLRRLLLVFAATCLVLPLLLAPATADEPAIVDTPNPASVPGEASVPVPDDANVPGETNVPVPGDANAPGEANVPGEANIPAAQSQRFGRLLKVPLPVTADTERLVKRFVDRTLDEARAKELRPVLIFEFDIPPSQENFGRGSQFGASLETARYLSSDALAGATTVAYLPRSIQGHAVLVALACDEIIMAPDASIGAAGIDSDQIEDVMRSGYREIAQRRRTVPVELAIGMLDPAHEVLDVETDVSREFITPGELDALAERHPIKSKKTIVTAGEAATFSGVQSRQLGFVSYLADDRTDVERALQLSHGDIEEAMMLGDSWKAVRVDVEGLITFRKAEQVRQQIENAVGRDRANFICLRIDSAGGSVEDSANLANFLVGLPANQVRTVAYIPYEARSDAALVALACDQVVMLPDAVLGGPGSVNMTRDEIDGVKPGVQQRAKDKNLAWSLPTAMIDPNVEVFRCTRTDAELGLVDFFSTEELQSQTDPTKWSVGPRVTTPGQQFQVQGTDAVDFHLANHVVDDFGQFKELYGLEDDPTLFEPSWTDSLVRILASPVMSVLLLIIAGGALYAEMHTPGVGLGGFLGLVCVVLFFWAQFVGDSLVWLDVLLFLLGLGCLAIEIFILPGFGIFGIGGGALILISLVLATQNFILPQNSYQLRQFQISLTVVAAAALGVVASGALLNRWLPRAPFLNRLMLSPPAGEEKESISRSESLVHFEGLLGEEGTTTTQLTPSGKARFGERLVDVIADGELIKPGVRVRVVEIHGNRVIVEPTVRED